MNTRNALLIFGFFVLVVVIALVATADETEGPGDHGTRAGETYVGSEECNSCRHGSSTQEYQNWSATLHGIDFAKDWTYHGEYLNKYTMIRVGGHYENGTTDLIGDCGECHVVGFNQTDIGGFDPELPWDDPYNLPLLKIGCENCHGPGSAHKSSASASDINLGPDRYAEACAGTDEAGCHSGYRQWGNETIGGWTQSMHAPYENDPSWDDGMNKRCARCKSPSQYDSSIDRADQSKPENQISKEDFRGITCGDCHDPHPDPANTHEYQLRWEVEDSCDACHNGGHHETMRTEDLADTPSVDRDDYPYMDEVSCVECHMWSSPRGLRGTIYERQGHSFTASIQACLQCHSEIFKGYPEFDNGQVVVEDGEVVYAIPDVDDTVNWTKWETEYLELYEEWEHVVEAAQERHETLTEEVEALYHIIDGIEEDDVVIQRGIKDIAEGNGTWTDHLDELFEQAEYDMELAEHASHGAHNPAYGIALLNAAKGNFTEIIEELSVGILKGKVTDESDVGIADVFISINGHGTKTDSDGNYTLIMEPGTYTVSAFKLGTIEKETTGVVISAAAVTTQDFTLAPDFDGDGTADTSDDDDDNDGYNDTVEGTEGADPKDPDDTPLDTDKDYKPDSTDTDDDNDGVLDTDDAFPTNPSEWVDTDGDNTGDNKDTDDDGDGVADTEDPAPWDSTVKEPQTVEKEVKEEAETTMYLIIIIVLIVVIVLLFVMMLKKGGSKPSLPPEEPPAEPPMEEELEEEV
ncbi:MAG: carboxypeptidase regulatory-like domain-containing protein [Thermoplasmata archaeon]|nr:MAG: carboxypeptidase regulatory-like domain-containing protein [Thermoplasmata archaeon]